MPDPIDIRVGARVRAWRLLAGMGQEALARRLGVSFRQLQKYERGSNRISASRLYRIARILRVPPGAFFEELGDETPVGPATREGLELVRAFRKIPGRHLRTQILVLLKSLATQSGRQMATGSGRAGLPIRLDKGRPEGS